MRDLDAAADLGKSEDEWWAMPYFARVTAVARFEANWRIKALRADEEKKKKN